MIWSLFKDYIKGETVFKGIFSFLVRQLLFINSHALFMKIMEWTDNIKEEDLKRVNSLAKRDPNVLLIFFNVIYEYSCGVHAWNKFDLSYHKNIPSFLIIIFLEKKNFSSFVFPNYLINRKFSRWFFFLILSLDSDNVEFAEIGTKIFKKPLSKCFSWMGKPEIFFFLLLIFFHIIPYIKSFSENWFK